VKANQADLLVRAPCETLKVSASGCYAWRDCALSKQTQENSELSELIGQDHRVSDQTCGIPRIRAELADTGGIASRKRMPDSCGRWEYRVQSLTVIPYCARLFEKKTSEPA